MRYRTTAAFVVSTLVAGTVSAGATSGDATHSGVGDKTRSVRHGSDAVAFLGDSLPLVAARYGFDASELRDELLDDLRLFVDAGGNIGYAEPPVSATAVSPARPLLDAADVPSTADGLFSLSSRTSATRKILLDVDGHITTGTAWNKHFNNGDDIVSAPWDRDGDASNWSTQEIAEVYRMWLVVAEDFAPFDVDVTLVDRGVDLVKDWPGDTSYGVRIVVTPTKWFPQTVSGVALIGSIGFGVETPAFCFSEQLRNNGAFVGECASHEIGHTVALRHDGTATVEYYSGHGSWAPIMGSNYMKPVTQWSSGEYVGASNTEDDVATIAGQFPTRSDDHGDTADTATMLDGGSGQGVIETRGDVDMFAVSFSASSTVSFTADPSSPFSNLDMSLVVRNPAGDVVATSDPPTLAAGAPVNVSPGTYTFAVDGVGSGETPTVGYSDYASLGAYTVTVQHQAGTSQPPAAKAAVSTRAGVAPLQVHFSSSGSNDPDGRALTYRWDFGDGGSSTAANPTYVYLRAGTFTMTLTVSEPGGSSSTVTRTIVVYEQVTTATARVSVRQISGVRAGRAKVRVVATDGATVPNARVVGVWSGVTSKRATGRTDAQGRVILRSPVAVRSGTIRFTVRLVEPPVPVIWDGVSRSAKIRV
jgi:PKD repeat protein